MRLSSYMLFVVCGFLVPACQSKQPPSRDGSSLQTPTAEIHVKPPMRFRTINYVDKQGLGIEA
ncbi:MAG: hypothetical protein AAB393_08090, partial [Bacteroidota bacterium]